MSRIVYVSLVMTGLILLGVHDIAGGNYKVGLASMLLGAANGLLLL